MEVGSSPNRAMVQGADVSNKVVEVHHPFTAQDIGSLLNAGVQFVMRWLPIFHLPTFSLDLIPRELCASIFCVGLLIAAEPAFFGLGCALLGKTRSDLLQVSFWTSWITWPRLNCRRAVCQPEHSISIGFGDTTGNV